MPTPSIRITENLRRAIKNSKYSIGALAREGLEQAVIDDFIGVCWVCGEAIHREERHWWIDRHRYETEIAEPDINWVNYSDPADYRTYNQEVEKDEKEEGGNIGGFHDYHDKIGNLLAIRENPVEFCHDCSQYLKQAQKERISPTDIPIPYLYRDVESKYNVPQWNVDLPRLMYVADSTAVNSAGYVSFQRRNDESVFWWAARNRQELKQHGMNIWLQIAKRSHAHRFGWGAPLVPTFELVINQINFLEEWNPGGFDEDPPGFPKRSLDIVNDGFGAKNHCPACGNPNPFGDLFSYCSNCFYWDPQYATSDGCDQLYPHIKGSLNSSNVTLRCPDCEHEEAPPGDYAEALVNEYRPILETMEYAIPLDIGQI